MAEALLRHALSAEPDPLRSMKVISAGVAARMGEPVTENSVYALKKVGLDITGHFSQPLTQRMVSEADLILCMTESHRALIEVHFNPTPKNVYLFREFMNQPGDKEIEDPYGLSLKAYEATRDSMVEALPGLLAFLRKTYSNSSR